MFSVEEVERAIVQLWNDDEPENPTEYNGDLLESGEAEQVLIDLGVEDAEERIEWMNITRLDSVDICALANVEFTALPCENCGGKQLEGDPDDWDFFQGVLQSDGLTTVCLEPFGESAMLCSDCIATLRSFF